MTDQEVPPPGWYPDSTGANRYWDGAQWTEHLADEPAAAVATPVFCTNCGTSMSPQAMACSACGFGVGSSINFCRNCAAPATPGQTMCLTCGSNLTAFRPDDKTKMAAGLLAIFLGGFGVHKFYLGYTTAGVIQILITLVTCGIGSIVALVEGIIYLTKSDAEFHQTYVVGKKEWF